MIVPTKLINMKTIIEKNGVDVQVLNLSTNIITVLLFICYSVANRIGVPDMIAIALAGLFALNAVASAYTLYRNNVLKIGEYNKLNFWIPLRVIANVGLGILSYSITLG